jgi:hypothetical protein
MSHARPGKSISMGVLLVLILFAVPGRAYAHCDTMDGPVVKAAQKALETGTVNLVLLWVRPEDELEIRAAFDRTLQVRNQSVEARELADHFFFETLVRVHRASEGAPYTGLKPAGTDLGLAVPAADRAIATGSLAEVEQVLLHAIRDGLRAHFQDVMEKKDYRSDDVAAGRQYVAAYVPYMHYVEGVYEAATSAAAGHYPEPKKTEPAHHPRH